MSLMNVQSIPEIKDNEFNFFKDLIKNKAGITLIDTKSNLVQARLGKRLRAYGFTTWQQYIDLLKNPNNQEYEAFLNSLTTNKTEFYREKIHFDFLIKYFTKNKPKEKVSLWVAACSYGQEAYTLAMTMEKIKDKIGYFDYQILATDIDTDVLKIAQRGVYDATTVQRDVSIEDQKRFFLKGTKSNASLYKISDALKQKIKFRQHNLCNSDRYPVKFDVIFVRNVLIYFDQKTINHVIDKLHKHLKNEAILFTGLCEAITEMKWNFDSPIPCTYLKTSKKTTLKLVKNTNKKIIKTDTKKTESKVSPLFDPNKKIKVLIVDDSKVIQKLMSSVISKTKEFELFGVASDPLIAEKLMEESTPDVITLDHNMPHMTGMEYLQTHLNKRNIPVVMISGVANEDGVLSLKAMELGAVDFIEKPELGKMDEFEPILIDKIKIAYGTSKVPNKIRQNSQKNFSDIHVSMRKDYIIAIGSSTGGTVALGQLLPTLPEDTPPILITQHIPKKFSSLLATRLDSICKIKVKEAIGNEVLEPGLALIAPGDQHMFIKQNKDGKYIVCLNDGEKVNNHKPSVDVLFDSVADVAKKKAVGVILTGMGKDGAKGMLKMKAAGAHTIAQNEESCVVFGMPREAIEIGAATQVVSLEECAAAIAKSLRISQKKIS